MSSDCLGVRAAAAVTAAMSAEDLGDGCGMLGCLSKALLLASAATAFAVTAATAAAAIAAATRCCSSFPLRSTSSWSMIFCTSSHTSSTGLQLGISVQRPSAFRTSMQGLLSVLEQHSKKFHHIKSLCTEGCSQFSCCDFLGTWRSHSGAWMQPAVQAPKQCPAAEAADIHVYLRSLYTSINLGLALSQRAGKEPHTVPGSYYFSIMSCWG